MENTYNVLTQVLDVFEGKIEKMNRRARKLNLPEFKIEVVDYFRESDMSTGEMKEYTVVKVEGEKPYLKDYEFIGKINHHIEMGNTLFSVEGKEIPEKYRESDSYCEHCNSKRRRKDTFILKNKTTGDYIQVGRNCLTDFLDGEDYVSNLTFYTNMVEKLSDISDELEETGGSFGVKYEETFSLHTYLHFVIESIKIRGFISKRMASEEERLSTGDHAWGEAFNPHLKDRHRDIHIISNETVEITEKVIQWGKELGERENLNDYTRNLNILAEKEMVTYSTKNFAASMYTAYMKDLEIIKEKERKNEERKKSEYVGEIKERKEFTLTVNKVIYVPNQFGATSIHLMTDSDGNEFVWFSSSHTLDEDEIYNMKGTIKEHKEYNGTKQTVITRCKVSGD